MGMKFKLILKLMAAGFAVGLMAAGCAKDDMARQETVGSLPLLLSTGGERAVLPAQEVVSRTGNGGDEWLAMDKIGVYMTSDDKLLPEGILSEGGNAADNVKYDTRPGIPASSASFAPSNTGETIYYPKTGNVNIVAYYPYCVSGSGTGEIGSDCIYNIDITDQSTEAKQAAVDALYAKKTGVEPSKNAVTLEFAHLMSKITLYVKAGEGVDAADISSLAASDVIFEGMPVSARIALASGTCTAGTVSGQAVFSPLKWASAPEGCQASFTAILIPQAANTYPGRKVAFESGGRDYVLEIPDTDEFAAGNHYVYRVSVKKTGIVIDCIDIMEWNCTPQEEIGVRAPGIYTAEDLVAFSAQWNATAEISDAAMRKTAQSTVISEWGDNGRSDGVVRVRADIDMSAAGNFDPIGSLVSGDNNWGFTGTFDGGNFTISNLRIDRGGDNYTGLFGHVTGGKVRDVILDNCNITGNNYVGAIAGLSNASSVISNCSVTGAMITAVSKYSGGIAGVNNNSKLTGCSVTGTTVSTQTDWCSGGIAGVNNSNGEIDVCSVVGGAVTGKNTVGGAVGWNNNGNIGSCHVGNVTVAANQNNAGGIVGDNTNSGIVAECSAAWVTVTAATYRSGGIAGWNTDPDSKIEDCLVDNGVIEANHNNSGGIVGENDGIVNRCRVNEGTVTANETSGGVVGWNTGSGASIAGCQVNAVVITAKTYQSGGIAGYNSLSSVINGCSVTKATVISDVFYAGGIVGLNSQDCIVSGCIVIDGTITAGDRSGGIAGQNSDNAVICGSVASPDNVNIGSGEDRGVLAGYNADGIIRYCYWGEITGLDAVGEGMIIECGVFERTGFGGFFDMGDIGNTPIDRMNDAIQALNSSASYRWMSGGMGNYPVVYIP